MFAVGLVPQTLWSAFHGRDDFQYSSRCFLIGFDLDYTRTKWRAYIVHPHSIDEHIRDAAKPSAGDLVADGSAEDVAKLILSSTPSSSLDSSECQEEDSPWHGEDDEWWTTDTSTSSWGGEDAGAGAGTEWFPCTSTRDASSDKSVRRTTTTSAMISKALLGRVRSARVAFTIPSTKIKTWPRRAGYRPSEQKIRSWGL